MKDVKAGLLPLAVLGLFWVTACILVDPRGDFPVLDDWAYVKTVQTLVAGGGLKFSDWSASNLISQVFWGAGLASLFGATPTVLRVSSLVAGLVAGFAIYRLFRLAKVSRSLALLGALASLFNPLFFILSFSFMTDIPYAAFQFVSMWLLASGIIHRDRIRQGLGWLAGAAALLCRQLGVFIPVGFAAEAALRRPFNLKRVLLALAPIVAFVALQGLYEHWLESTGRMPALYGRQINSIAGGILSEPVKTMVEAAKLPGYCFYYFGLFALPLTLPAVAVWRPMLSERFQAWVIPGIAIISLVVCGLSFALDWNFPMWRDTMNKYNGLGSEDFATRMEPWLMGCFTLLASLGGVLLVAALAAVVVRWSRRAENQFDISIFSAAVGLALLAPVAVIAFRFDRYLIPIIPCVLLALSSLLSEFRPPRAALLAGAAAALVMGLFSVAATHDYMAAKRVQWQVYLQLAEKVGRDRIDGGWVLNGAARFGTVGRIDDLTTWAGSADYLVASHQRPGYVILARYKVERWLPWNRVGKPILLQQRGR